MGNNRGLPQDSLNIRVCLFQNLWISIFSKIPNPLSKNRKKSHCYFHRAGHFKSVEKVVTIKFSEFSKRI